MKMKDEANLSYKPAFHFGLTAKKFLEMANILDFCGNVKSYRLPHVFLLSRKLDEFKKKFQEFRKTA